VTCSSQATATAELKAAGFTVTVAPDRVPSPCPAGAVAGTEPGGQTVVGGAVRLRLSSGAPAATPTPPR
jgi:beta-lactam-binding protein with PASTA domain